MDQLLRLFIIFHIIHEIDWLIFYRIDRGTLLDFLGLFIIFYIIHEIDLLPMAGVQLLRLLIRRLLRLRLILRWGSVVLGIRILLKFSLLPRPLSLILFSWSFWSHWMLLVEPLLLPLIVTVTRTGGEPLLW